jgi:hypothetical protein
LGWNRVHVTKNYIRKHGGRISSTQGMCDM